MRLFPDPAVGVADPLLARACALAERGRGTVSPNPLVGCVVVRDGAIVGEGYHERPGGPHAEVMALDAAGDAARGADVYVTLEPCNHHGRTPPCVDRLLAAGVASVTIGMPDPNPAVSGGGAAALGERGVRVTWSADPAPFERQNEAWLHRMRTGRPLVTAKVALTLDGHATLVTGRRSRITGTGGARVTTQLRERATAVGVGALTLAVDDPSLTVRDASGVLASRQPRRVVIARSTVPSRDARVFNDGNGAPTVLLDEAAATAAESALAGTDATVLGYRSGDGLAGALAALAADGCDDILMEPGPRLLSALWAERLVDMLVVVSAGGMGGPAPLLYDGPADATEDDLRPVMRAVAAAVVDDDAVTVWRPRSPGADRSEKGR